VKVKEEGVRFEREVKERCGRFRVKGEKGFKVKGGGGGFKVKGGGGGFRVKGGGGGFRV
jgi:hypothetical protein